MRPKRRFFIPASERSIPYYIESVGFNPEQETIIREDGYPCYHWLQTVKGQGDIWVEGKQTTLPANYGILFFPESKHRYQASTNNWSTYYMTFDGPQVDTILSLFGMQDGMRIHWEADSVLTTALEDVLTNVIDRHDSTGLENSIDVYRFLVMLKKHGKMDRSPSIHNVMERMDPLLVWMEEHYSNPNIGVNEMAERLQMSSRHLNSLFKKAYGYTPYYYLLNLRIRKSKEMLLNEQEIPINAIAVHVGFRDASHYISIFKRLEGTTPERFRRRFR